MITSWLNKFRSPRWKWTQADLPWFDQPDALARLDRMRKDAPLNNADYELLKSWTTQGYCVAERVIPEADIDGMVADLAALWTATEPFAGLQIHDVIMAKGEAPRTVDHAEILKLSPDERARARDESFWRVHGLHNHSPNAKRIFENGELKRIAALVFGRAGDPTFTINFMYGSRQALHQDSCVFHLAPPNFVMGAWLACEDISPDSGPLVYCPASHKEPIYPGFADYPQTNLRTMPKDRMPEYYEYVSNLASKYERHQFLGKKGDVLLWHGMLIHGGDEVKRPELTRKSYVCHYVPPGMDVSPEIKGPFNW